MHKINFEIYPENCDKKQIQKWWDNYVKRVDYEEGAEGLPGEIRWINHVCNSYEDALKYIEANDNKWYDQLAVKYKEVKNSKAKNSKKLTELEERMKIAYKKWQEKSNNIHYKNVKSEFVACKKCRSRLATAYVTNYCPLCKTDLRPESTLKAIEAAHEHYLKLEEQFKNLKKEEHLKMIKNKNNVTIKWLLKTEYHI